MEKLTVDKEKCIGCGACVGLVDSVFEFGDDGLAQVKEEVELNKLDEDTKNDVIDAKEGCPTGAIEEK